MKKIFKYILCVAIMAGMMIAGEEVMWGSSYYYARLTVKSGGNGTVYVSQSGTTSQETETSNGGAEATFLVNATPSSGYHFNGWTIEKGKGSVTSNTASSITVTSGSSSTYDSDEGSSSHKYYNSYTATASFAENYYAKLTLNSNGISVTPTGGGTGNVASTSEKVKFNISTSTESSGYHFYNWTGSGVSFGSSTSASTTASVSPATTGGSGNANSYTATANYKPNQYYATVSLTIYSEKADGTGQATISGNQAQIVEGSPYTSYSTTKGGNIQCNLKYLSAQDGWHFAQWNKGTSPGTCSFGKNTDKQTTFTAQVSSSYDDDNASPYTANNYTIQCKFVENYYTQVNTAVSGGGKAYVTYGTTITESVTTTTANDGYGQTYAREVDYAVRAVADPGYHFVGWTIDNTTESTIVTPDNTTSQLKVKAVNSKQGESNKNKFVITANFAKDMYNAKLTTAVSSAGKGTGTGSTALVSSDNSSWSGSSTISSDNPNADVPFYVKATPAAGYKFVGWSETDGSTAMVSGLGATGVYKVKSSSTQGSTNAKNLYAVFDNEYSIVINALGSGSGNVVFNVSGPSTYRVSVPIGGTLTIKDVAPGTHTVTPEPAWNWSISVMPASLNTSYGSENKSIMNFTVTAKPSAKKHLEARSTITDFPYSKK